MDGSLLDLAPHGFPERYRTQAKKGPAVEQDVLVLEIAIGLHRCVYNWNMATSL